MAISCCIGILLTDIVENAVKKLKIKLTNGQKYVLDADISITLAYHLQSS